MNKIKAIEFITRYNPVCDDCARGNLDQVRKAAGLYQLIKDLLAADQDWYSEEELKNKIVQATSF